MSKPSSTGGSVTRLAEAIGAGDTMDYERAVADLWTRLGAQLRALAHKKLSERVRRREDADDVVLSAFKSFAMRQREGDFSIGDRADLWRVLVDIVCKKASNVANFHQRQKRSVKSEAAGRVAGTGDESSAQLVNLLAERGPTPDVLNEYEEELEARLNMLEDEALRKIALARMSGRSSAEIAEALECSVRSVERKLSLIRAKWER